MGLWLQGLEKEDHKEGRKEENQGIEEHAGEKKESHHAGSIHRACHGVEKQEEWPRKCDPEG